MCNRRLLKSALVATLATAAAALAYGQRGGGGQAAPTVPPLQVKALSGGAYWTSGGAGGNTGFIVGADGVIVIDAKMTADSAKEFLAEIAKVTPKPVTHVILTHSDPDHVNGLVGFPKGLTIIAQENCKKEMEDALAAAAAAAAANAGRQGGGGRGGAGANMAALRDYLPTQTVSKPSEDMTIDGVKLRLLHFAPGHTSGDLMVYLPDQKILYTGDILTMQFASPFVHREKNGTPQGMIANLKGMLALNVDTYVPGHGDLQTKAPIEKRLAESQKRYDDVKKLFAEGKTLHETRIAVGDPLPTGNAGGFNAPSFTETSYRQISADQPYDKHDLTGVWSIRGGGGFTLNNNPPPMTAWAKARYDAAKPGLGPRGAPLGNDPIMSCDPMGLVRSIVWGVYPTEIVQTPKETFMLFDWFDARRAIWTDGRKLPEDPEPRFYAYSVGHWEGDTFVVESNGFDDRQWADADAHPISTEARLEERYRRIDHDTIKYDLVLTDPKSYTQPWVARDLTATLNTHGLNPDVEMREDICVPSVEAKYKEQVREPAGGAK